MNVQERTVAMVPTTLCQVWKIEPVDSQNHSHERTKSTMPTTISTPGVSHASRHVGLPLAHNLPPSQVEQGQSGEAVESRSLGDVGEPVRPPRIGEA